MQQINFEFSFSVGKLQASLFKSTSATAEKALADATLEGFGLTFAQRKYDMSVDLFLRNVTLAMASQSGAEKRPLLSSAADSSSTSSDLKLVRVKYKKVQKDSPEFMGVHEGVDQSVDTELSTFKITLAPEPILSLYDFIMTTFVPKDEEGAGGNEQAAKQQQQQDAQVSSDKIRVRVKLTSAQGTSLIIVIFADSQSRSRTTISALLYSPCLLPTSPSCYEPAPYALAQDLVLYPSKI
jgi:vacuolar protein sorting-associated protein 13A/C